jgi:nucleotide-binding universal stress UspA family protein
METLETHTHVTLKNILYLTDFSEPSEAALPFATAIARNYGAHVHALHVLLPDPYVYATPGAVGFVKDAEEESAKAALQRLESQLAGVSYETILEWGVEFWSTIERNMKDRKIDLIVLGTHGRTGAQKFLLGSVAEEIFRRSPVPVLTIGPQIRVGLHSAAHFHKVLFATDFSPEANAAAPYAISFAQENHARLLLMHVVPQRDSRDDQQRIDLSVAEAIHQLYDVVPKNVELNTPPEVVVEYGGTAARILEAAEQRNADLIVLGVRDAAGRLGAATHLGRATAHHVVAHAHCPVLTIAHAASAVAEASASG